MPAANKIDVCHIGEKGWIWKETVRAEDAGGRPPLAYVESALKEPVALALDQHLLVETQLEKLKRFCKVKTLMSESRERRPMELLYSAAGCEGAR